MCVCVCEVCVVLFCVYTNNSVLIYVNVYVLVREHKDVCSVFTICVYVHVKSITDSPEKT